MPLVRIDLVEGRTEEQVRVIADAVHAAIVEVLDTPERDRFQIIDERKPGRIIAEDAGLGFERSDAVVMVQIVTQGGRTTEVKQRLFAAVASRLDELGIAGRDVFLGLVENTACDWSFGFGRAQYVEGDLSVPAHT